MTEPIDAPLSDPVAGENRAVAGTAQLLARVLEVLQGHPAGPGDWPPPAEQITPPLDAAMGSLEFEAPEMLPLLADVWLSVQAIEPASRDLRTALAHALKLLLRQITGERCADWPASQILAIADLRSARGVACLNILHDGAADAAENAGVTPDHRGELSSELAGFRKSLLELLRAEGPTGAKGIAQVCRRLEMHSGAAGVAQVWDSAAQLFDLVADYGAGHHVAVRRAAVRLEKHLRRALGDAALARATEPPGRLEGDLDLLRRVLPRAYAHPAAVDPPAPLDLEALRLEEVLETLRQTPGLTGGLGAVRDAFLVEGRIDDWLSAWKLEQSAAGAGEIAATVEVWLGTSTAPHGGDGGDGLNDAAEGQLEQAGALLKRIDEAVAQVPAAPGSAMPAISVDESLLEHLNLAAAEIRGARSKAEANLGSFRGGLENMERTIKSLRSQLEALEVDSSSSAGAGEPGRQGTGGMPATLGALSRGIEELAGLKDALQTLTEETESVLASHAGEDAELEQGLLRTRLVPIGGQFESWNQWVARAAAGWGVAATLRPQGGETMLERGHVEALSRALKPMLEACVRDGLTGSASPARIHPDSARLELSVSQPRFDVRVDLSYEGAPLAATTLAELKPEFDAFGAVCGSRVDPRGRTRLSVLVPGPPRPMDLLLVALGGRRVGLPVEGIYGVCRPQRSAVANDDGAQQLTYEDQLYRVVSLADTLGLAEADQGDGMCVLVARGEQRLACTVDTVVSRERLLVRSPGPLLWGNPWVVGAVIDELAAPTLVLDLDAVCRSASNLPG